MKNNFCIIMAGGIGSRFWPFSRKACPKQFLDFFGCGRTLLQMTFDRILGLIPKENIFIVTSENYKNMVLEQLPQLAENQVLLEPMRRNTAPCIAYASYKILSISPEANIIVMPSDHLILKEEIFRHTIENGFKFLEEKKCILTLGMTPTRPETAYGYIQVSDGEENPSRVKTFTEKPNLELAKLFFESGEFYWNSGMFLFSTATIIEEFRRFLPDLNSKFERGKEFFGTEKEQDFINEIYPTCQNISIDYGIMEKTKNVYVMTADFGWSDCGTWESLYEFSAKDEQGNATLNCQTQFYESRGNIVALNGGKLAVVQGLENYIVAESNGVLMICPRAIEEKIRQHVNDIDMKFNGEFN